MLGKRFSFNVQKKILFTETFDLKWQNVIFFTKLSLPQQKKLKFID